MSITVTIQKGNNKVSLKHYMPNTKSGHNNQRARLLIQHSNY